MLEELANTHEHVCKLAHHELGRRVFIFIIIIIIIGFASGHLIITGIYSVSGKRVELAAVRVHGCKLVDQRVNAYRSTSEISVWKAHVYPHS